MGILDHVPTGYNLRDVQRDVLLEVEEEWDRNDVLVIQAPVASGKSLISITIARWREAVGKAAAILTPQVILQEQYNRDFSDIPVLKGRTRYKCKTKGYDDCAEFNETTGRYCVGCNYKCAIQNSAKSKKAIMNFHSYLYNKVYKETLIVDEAHNLVSMLADVYTLKLWRHKDHYPDDMETKDDLIAWLEGESAKLYEIVAGHTGIPTPEVRRARKRHSKYINMIDGLSRAKELFFMHKDRSMYYGKELEVIEVKPISLKLVPHAMWPRKDVKKIVLMSATITGIDVERVGLETRTVRYIECPSPIPTDSRPLKAHMVAEMSYKKVNESTAAVCEQILDLASRHQGKGIVHLTYGLVPKFKKHLKGDRYMWHTKDTREEVYQKFLQEDTGVILMACGMSEGIDLAGDEFEWQVIAKVQFPSLVDPLNRHYAKNDRETYAWETAKTLIQQYGRICRTPIDHGTTYILDKAFQRYYSINNRLFPQYFRDAIKWRTG